MFDNVPIKKGEDITLELQGAEDEATAIKGLPPKCDGSFLKP
jgi:hypothetical protein